MEKNHYRKVFKSDHLSSYDLEDFIEQKRPLEFTIAYVKQEYRTPVAGKKIDANIAYFIEPIKPMVLNATNSKILAKLANSNFVEDWKNIPVELFIMKNINFGKESVQGIRLKEESPIPITQERLKEISESVELFTEISQINDLYKSLESREKANKDILTILGKKKTAITNAKTDDNSN